MKEGAVYIGDKKSYERLSDRDCLTGFDFRVGDNVYHWWCENPGCNKQASISHAIKQKEFITNQIHEKPETVLPMYGIGSKYFTCTLDTFAGYPEIVERMKQYLTEPIYSLLFTAPCGTGKTHIAIALLIELVRMGRGNMMFKSVPELMLDLRSSFAEESAMSETDIINRHAMYSYLILDDLGSEKQSDYSIASLYMIIDRRLTTSRPTIITTNLTLEQINECVSSRIASRLAEYRIFEFNMDDYRTKR